MVQTKKLKELLNENAIGIEEFSACLGIDDSYANELVSGSKKLTKLLARQIEQTFCKPKYWLDEDATQGDGSYDLFG